MRAVKQQVGYLGAAGLIFPPHLQHTSPVQCDPTLISRQLRGLSLFFLSLSVSIILCLQDADRQRSTHVLRLQQRGQGLCPGQPVCSCSAVFYSTGLHKQTAPRAAAFKMDSRMQSQARTHTNTHTCWHPSRDAHKLRAHKTKASFLRYFSQAVISVRVPSAKAPPEDVPLPLVAV